MNLIHTLGIVATVGLATLSASADDYIRQPIRIDKTFDQALQGGCKYTVSVSGTITPVAAQSSGQPPLVNPHLDVSAQALCPNEAAVKVTDNVLGTGPLTWAQLEDSLSARSHVYTVENKHHCTYGAVFKVVDKRLELNRFDHNCQTL
ncbi:MAG TPA: hypothetical protein VGH28_00075 [Polyangiaceae bacterium]|jgi:hypothetical protein